MICSNFQRVSFLYCDPTVELLDAFPHWSITYSTLSHHVYMEMTLKHLHFNWIDMGKEYWIQLRLHWSWLLLQQSIYVFMTVTHCVIVCFVAIKNSLSIYVLSDSSTHTHLPTEVLYYINNNSLGYITHFLNER